MNPSDIDNYYVRQQARKLISDHVQMSIAVKKKDPTPLVLNRGGNKFSENEGSTFCEMIDADIAKSKTKCKTWKQLDMYLKWKAIMSYLIVNELTNEEEYVKLVFQTGKLSEIVFDAKLQTITKIQFPERK